MPARTLATLAAGVLVGVAAATTVGALRKDPAPSAAVRNAVQAPPIEEPARPRGTAAGSHDAFRVTERFTLLSATERRTRTDGSAHTDVSAHRREVRSAAEPATGFRSSAEWTVIPLADGGKSGRLNVPGVSAAGPSSA